MSNYTLILLDTSGIQEYVFGSNNLAVNIGASELVVRALGDWLFEALPSPHNLRREAQGLVYVPQTIEGHKLRAEVIYRGGGNALIIFDNSESAITFTQTITHRALVEAPSLQLVVAHHEDLDWENHSLHNVFQNTLRPTVGRRKLDRQVSAPLAGLSVTAACVFTGQPATRLERVNPSEPHGVYFSDEIAAKLDATDEAEARLHRLLPRVRVEGYEFVRDFDYFGAPGESSYVAVIHADGNAMGKQLATTSRSTKCQNKIANVPTGSVSFRKHWRRWRPRLCAARWIC